MSEDSRVGILLRGSSVRLCLVVLNQGCCGSGQYSLPDRMLRLDANTTLNESYVLFITLVNITYQSRDQHLPSIHSWDSSPWQVLYIPLFCFVRVFFNCLSCSACILQIRNKPNQFLIQINVYFFIIISSFIFYFSVIIHNFITSPVPKRFTMFFIYLHFNIILHFIWKFTLFFTTRFIIDLF